MNKLNKTITPFTTAKSSDIQALFNKADELVDFANLAAQKMDKVIPYTVKFSFNPSSKSFVGASQSNLADFHEQAGQIDSPFFIANADSSKVKYPISITSEGSHVTFSFVTGSDLITANIDDKDSLTYKVTSLTNSGIYDIIEDYPD